MSLYYAFEGNSMAEFEMTSPAINPIIRWNERLCKKAKLEKIFWKIDQEYGPVKENEKPFNLRRYVNGYMTFDKPVDMETLMDMDQPDFSYVSCTERLEPGDYYHISSKSLRLASWD